MTSTTALVRVPLTLAAAVAFHVSLSPPTAPSPAMGDRQAICTTARFVSALLTKGLFCASALTDTYLLLAPHLPRIPIPTAETLLSWIRNALSNLGPGLLSHAHIPRGLCLHTTITIAGTTLAVAGALLRFEAYKALGRFYACPNPGPGACEHPVSRGNEKASAQGHAHALITSGPYTLIRHPGYAGLVLCTTGLAVSHLSTVGTCLGLSGTWTWPLSCAGISGGSMLSAGGISAGMRSVALACAVLTTVAAVRRIDAEERALSARFKGEWEAWRRVVRYKLIPGVY